MKITRYAMMLAAATGLLSACQKLDEVKAYDPDKVVAPVLHALPGEIVITPDNMGSTQTFTWDAADFGVRTQINYSIEASYNDGAKLVLFTGMNRIHITNNGNIFLINAATIVHILKFWKTRISILSGRTVHPMYRINKRT